LVSEPKWLLFKQNSDFEKPSIPLKLILKNPKRNKQKNTTTPKNLKKQVRLLMLKKFFSGKVNLNAYFCKALTIDIWQFFIIQIPFRRCPSFYIFAIVKMSYL